MPLSSRQHQWRSEKFHIVKAAKPAKHEPSDPFVRFSTPVIPFSPPQQRPAYILPESPEPLYGPISSETKSPPPAYYPETRKPESPKTLESSLSGSESSDVESEQSVEGYDAIHVCPLRTPFIVAHFSWFFVFFQKCFPRFYKILFACPMEA